MLSTLKRELGDNFLLIAPIFYLFSVIVHTMSVALMWVVSPNSELVSGLGFLETTKLVDSSKARSFLRTSKIKNVGKKHKCHSCYSFGDSGFTGSYNGRKNDVMSRVVANPSGELAISSEQLVYDVVLKQAALVKEQMRAKEEEDVEVKPDIVLPGTLGLLSEAYDRCGEVCAEYAKTFYLGWFFFFFGYIYCTKFEFCWFKRHYLHLDIHVMKFILAYCLQEHC